MFIIMCSFFGIGTLGISGIGRDFFPNNQSNKWDRFSPFPIGKYLQTLT